MRAFVLLSIAFALSAYLNIVERCQIEDARDAAIHERMRADYAIDKAEDFAIAANINRDSALGNAALYAHCIRNQVVSEP